MKTAEKYIKKTLALALKAKGNVSPNPMVGCVIVKKEQVIAQGWHKRCGSDHAEVIALKKCGNQARGATLYVNLEPCYHYGRTSPCVDRIIESGIKHVVIAMKDPNPLTAGKSIAKLRRAGIKVTTGVLRKEARKLNEVFIKYITTGMPFVVAKSAQSLDGKIAFGNRKRKWITSREARTFARKKRNDFDAIMVGVNTVIKDDPRLTPADKVRSLKKIIVDSTLKISLKAKVFTRIKPGGCIIATTKQASARKTSLLTDKGVEVITCPEKGGRVDLHWLLKRLAKSEITSILLEGGAQLFGEALKRNLVDKVNIYVAPKIIGDQKALDSAVAIDPKCIDRSVLLKDATVKNIGPDIFIEGYLKGIQ